MGFSDASVSPSFLRTIPAKKPRTECCCQSVAVMMAAIVVPAGASSIATMRACLVSDHTADIVDCGRGLPLLIFRPAERVATFVLDLGLVMGVSKVGVTPSATPPQPRPSKSAGRARPQSGLSRLQVVTLTLRSSTEASQFGARLLLNWPTVNTSGSVPRFYHFWVRILLPQPGTQISSANWRKGRRLAGVCNSAWVFELPIRKTWRPFRQKSPATNANIPVLGRHAPETRFDPHCVLTVPGARILSLRQLPH